MYILVVAVHLYNPLQPLVHKLYNQVEMILGKYLGAERINRCIDTITRVGRILEKNVQ